MSPSSFPPTIPWPGAALCSTGSLGSVPPCPCSYCGAPTSPRPSRCARLPSRRATAAIQQRRRVDLPGSWGTLPYVPCSQTPAGPPRQTIGRSALLLQRSGVAFRLFDGVGSRDFKHFGAPSHGPHARCLRFVAAVAGTHARLASGWWSSLAGRDFNPRVPLRGFRFSESHDASSSPRLGLAHRSSSRKSSASTCSSWCLAPIARTPPSPRRAQGESRFRSGRSPRRTAGSRRRSSRAFARSEP